MNIQRYLIATVAVFAFVFLFEWLVHGMLLSDMYESTSTVWRSKADMQAHFPCMLAVQALFSVVVACFYACRCKDRGIKDGICFGLSLGALLAVLGFAPHTYLPIPMQLSLAWAAAGFVKGLGSGVVVGLIYTR